MSISYLKYQGFVGSAEQESDGGFFGKLLLERDLVTYQSSHLKGLEKEFQLSVREYKQDCKKLNKSPDKANASLISELVIMGNDLGGQGVTGDEKSEVISNINEVFETQREAIK